MARGYLPKAVNTERLTDVQQDFTGGINSNNNDKVIPRNAVSFAKNFDLTSEGRLEKRTGYTNKLKNIDLQKIQQEVGSQIINTIKGKIQAYHKFEYFFNGQKNVAEFWVINSRFYKYPFIFENNKTITWDIFDGDEIITNYFLNHSETFDILTIENKYVVFATGQDLLEFTNNHNGLGNNNDSILEKEYRLQKMVGYKPSIEEFLNRKYGQNLLIEKQKRKSYFNNDVLGKIGFIDFFTDPNIVVPKQIPYRVHPVINFPEGNKDDYLLTQFASMNVGSANKYARKSYDIFNYTERFLVPNTVLESIKYYSHLNISTTEMINVLGLTFKVDGSDLNTIHAVSTNREIDSFSYVNSNLVVGSIYTSSTNTSSIKIAKDLETLFTAEAQELFTLNGRTYNLQVLNKDIIDGYMYITGIVENNGVRNVYRYKSEGLDIINPVIKNAYGYNLDSYNSFLDNTFAYRTKNYIDNLFLGNEKLDHGVIIRDKLESNSYFADEYYKVMKQISDFYGNQDINRRKNHFLRRFGLGRLKDESFEYFANKFFWKKVQSGSIFRTFLRLPEIKRTFKFWKVQDGLISDENERTAIVPEYDSTIVTPDNNWTYTDGNDSHYSWTGYAYQVPNGSVGNVYEWRFIDFYKNVLAIDFTREYIMPTNENKLDYSNIFSGDELVWKGLGVNDYIRVNIDYNHIFWGNAETGYPWQHQKLIQAQRINDGAEKHDLINFKPTQKTITRPKETLKFNERFFDGDYGKVFNVDDYLKDHNYDISNFKNLDILNIFRESNSVNNKVKQLEGNKFEQVRYLNMYNQTGQKRWDGQDPQRIYFTVEFETQVSTGKVEIIPTFDNIDKVVSLSFADENRIQVIFNDGTSKTIVRDSNGSYSFWVNSDILFAINAQFSWNSYGNNYGIAWVDNGDKTDIYNVIPQQSNRGSWITEQSFKKIAVIGKVKNLNVTENGIIYSTEDNHLVVTADFISNKKYFNFSVEDGSVVQQLSFLIDSVNLDNYTYNILVRKEDDSVKVSLYTNKFKNPVPETIKYTMDIIGRGLNGDFDLDDVAKFIDEHKSKGIERIYLDSRANYEIKVEAKYPDYTNSIELFKIDNKKTEFFNELLTLQYPTDKLTATIISNVQTTATTLTLEVINDNKLQNPYYATKNKIITPITQEINISSNADFVNKCTKMYYKNGYLMYYGGIETSVSDYGYHKNTIFISDINRYNYIPQYNTIDINEKNQEIKKLIGWNNDFENIIFMDNKIIDFRFNSPAEASLKLITDESGLYASDSVVASDNKLFYLAENGVYVLSQTQMLNGLPQVKLVSKSIENLFRKKDGTYPKDAIGYNQSGNYHLIVNDVWDQEQEKEVHRILKLYTTYTSKGNYCWYLDESKYLNISGIYKELDNILYIQKDKAVLLSKNSHLYVDGDGEEFTREIENNGNDYTILKQENYTVYETDLISRGLNLEPYTQHTKNFRKMIVDIGIDKQNVKLAINGYIDNYKKTNTTLSRISIVDGQVIFEIIDDESKLLSINAGTVPGKSIYEGSFIPGISRWGLKTNTIGLVSVSGKGISLKVRLQQTKNEPTGFQVLGLGSEFRIRSLRATR